MKGFKLKFGTFFIDTVTCPIDPQLPITMDVDGVFQMFEGDGGDHSHIIFFFTQNGIGHSLSLDGTILPADNDGSVTQDPDGLWGLGASGKNHRDGCFGEGGGIKWTAELDPV